MTNPMIDYFRSLTNPEHPGWNKREFTDWRDEQMSWKTTSYIGDWSFLWDVHFEGPDALQLLKDSGINNFDRFEIGQAKHLIQCSELGKVIAEGIVIRLGEQSFSTQSTTAFVVAFLADSGKYDVKWHLEETFIFQVSGPNALAIIEKAADENVRDIKFIRSREVTIGGVTVRLLRQGMAGEVGFELHGPMAEHDHVWNTVLEAGAEHGIRQLGRRTAMINHLEAAFPTGGWHYMADWAGMDGLLEYFSTRFDTFGLGASLRGSFQHDDINEYLTSPIELGWGRMIDFNHEFTGKAALEAERDNPKRTRVTLEFNSDDVIDIYSSYFRDGEVIDFLDIPTQERWFTWFDEVQNDAGEYVGVSTTPGYSLLYRKVLTLSYLLPEYAEPGTEVKVLWGNPGTRQKLIRATVRPAPYKPDHRRDDLAAVPAAVSA
ncbi:aminomethyltransferase family protein [Okibacterium endophyticum]